MLCGKHKESCQLFLHLYGANHSGRAVLAIRLPPFTCWNCWFESRLEHGYLSVVYVVCCQVYVSASVSSLVQRSPTECGVSECDHEASTTSRP